MSYTGTDTTLCCKRSIAARLAVDALIRKYAPKFDECAVVDPDKTDAHIFIYVLMETRLEFKELFIFSVFTCNIRDTAGLPTISFTFRYHT